MRREQEFLGEFEPGGALNESDFRRGLEVAIEPGLLPKSQQYDALQAFVHWGINGNRPDLALEAYDAYVVHAWTWQTGVVDAEKAEEQKMNDDYFDARYKKEEETGQDHDGMTYFSLFEVTHYGAIPDRVRYHQKEGEAFRNTYLPKILEGLLENGETQKVYEFLSERRAIHNFRGYPRELDPEPAVDIFVATAEALLDVPNDDADFDREAAFIDIAEYMLEHELFARRPYRLASLREPMIAHGLPDPWEVFDHQFDNALRRFNDGMFGIQDAFEGIRAYLKAAQVGEVEDVRNIRDWPAHALESFDMLERNPSIPSGLALIIPAARSGNMHTSASDAFQSAPVLGANLLLAMTGDEEAAEKVMDTMHDGAAVKALQPAELSVADALRMTTKS